MMKSLNFAKSLDYDESKTRRILVHGAFGGRIDQTLKSVETLFQFYREIQVK